MSLVIIPAPAGTRSVSADPGPVGKLATTLLSVTVAGMAEPGRFRRGRVYAEQGAVVRLVLDTGVLHGEVQGSDPLPYEVQIRVDPLAAAGSGALPEPGQQLERHQVSRLVPDADEIAAWCSCPDGDSPCKHVVAVLTRFAGELSARPELLAILRLGGPAAARRADVGSNAQPVRHLRAVPGGSTGSAPRQPSTPSPFDSEAWHAYTGAHLPPPSQWAHLLTDAAPLVFASLVVDRTDVGAMLGSMVDAITTAFGSSPR